MLTDLADGSRDAVLIHHVDRLIRRPIELEQFLEVLTAAKVRHLGGDLDVGNGDGLMVLRMLFAVAANESSTESRRVKRKKLQNAEAGLPHGGYRRPFGYDDDELTIRQDEAPAALPCPSRVGILRTSTSPSPQRVRRPRQSRARCAASRP